MRKSGLLNSKTWASGAALTLALGCSSSATETPRPSLSGGDGGGGAGSAASAGANTSGATTSPTGVNLSGSNTGIVMSTGSSGTGGACQSAEIKFTPDIPTVMILVDRSSSMWDNMFWDPLRDGVLEVVQRLEQDVRFGLATFTGLMGQTCPLDLEDAGVIDFNNYDAIASFYNGIGRPNAASETPTAAGIQRARELLEADNATFPGPKFIMLVTDGNPDYCDNGQVECRADTTVRVLQDTFAADISTDSQDTVHGIRTFVVALPDPGINQNWLTAFANAGAGEAVASPQDTQYCSAIPAETAALLPTVDSMRPQASYGATMGPAQPYNVDPAQKDQLVQEISAVIAGVKSCTFDLGGELKIDEDRESEGKVTIQTVANPEGVEQPYDPSGVNGWKVNGHTQIELVGSSCATLRDPNTTGIDFGFPCGIVTPK